MLTSDVCEILGDDFLEKYVEKLKSYILKTKEEDCFWPIYSRMVHGR